MTKGPKACCALYHHTKLTPYSLNWLLNSYSKSQFYTTFYYYGNECLKLTHILFIVLIFYLLLFCKKKLRGTDGVFHYYHKPPSVLGTAKHILIIDTCGMNFKQLIIDSAITVNGQTLHVSSKSLSKVHLTAVHPCCISRYVF